MKSIFTILSLLITTMLFSQAFHENFETTPLKVSSTGSGIWGLNMRIQSQGLKSDSCVVHTGDTTYLTTQSFSTSGKYAVIFSFDQIAKIEFFDQAFIEYSTNGTTWTQLTGANYLGSGGFTNNGNKFYAGSYTDWIVQDTFAVPQNSWWKHEVFDISNLVSNTQNVWLRFVLIEDAAPGGTSPYLGNSVWFLDSLRVMATFSEVVPPTITLLSPIMEDTAYGSNPFNVGAHIFDVSGIDTAICAYHVMPEDIYDTVAMVLDATTADSFYCSIPFYGYGRTISYKIIATDASAAYNVGSTSEKSFYCKYSAGGTFIIGTATTSSTSYGPIFRSSAGSSYDFSRYSSVISASELAAAGVTGGGQIVKLEWYKTTAYKTNGNAKFDIYLKNSTKNVLSNTTWNNAVSGASKVYSTTTQSIPASTGWLPFVVTPFSYNGQSLEISTDWDISAVQGSPTTGSFKWRYTQGLSGVKTVGAAKNSKPPSLSTGYGGTRRPNIRITFLVSPNLINDAGVSTIVNPNSSVPANTNFYIDVKVKNFGVDTINSLVVKYALNGALQDSVVYTGISLYPDSTLNVRMDTLNVSSGSYTIKSWTEKPSGNNDFNYDNDTSSYTFYSCASQLSGNYTVGGASADFSSFADVALALNQCGINGPTVFNVNSGTYNENMELLSVFGSSATNTITFKSVSGDSTTVIMAHDANGAADNYVVKLRGTSFISFENMSFRSLDAIYGRVFDFSKGVHDVSIKNNIIKAVPTQVDNNKMYLICGLDSLGSNILIDENIISNGSYAISVFSKDSISNLKISNNIIHGHYKGGIHLKNTMSPRITGNEIYQDTAHSAPIFIGMLLDNIYGTPIIKKNKVLSRMSPISFGMRMNYSAIDSINRGQIVNNFFQINGMINYPSATTGILIVGSPNLDIFYNNVLITGVAIQSTAMYVYKAASDSLVIKNNNFTNKAGGYAFYVYQATAAQFESNYNNLYTFGGARFAKVANTVCNNLTAFQTATGGDTNSVSYNPYYSGSYDLHVTNNLLNGLGTPITGILTDIDGDIRNTTTPDIGADEFDPSPWDVSALEILTPLSACGLSNAEVVTVRIKNVGSAAITSGLSVSYSWPGGTAVTENVTTAMQPGDTLDYTFTTTADLDVFSTGKDSTFEFMALVSLATDPVHFNDTAYLDVDSKYQPSMPTTQPVTINYANSATLTATSNDSLTWWQYDTSSVPLAIVNTYITDPLYDTTVFWVSAGVNPSADSITTSFLSNNGHAGNMFNVTAYNTITIDSFYINGTSSSKMEVWYRQGSYVGHNTSSAGWTKLGDYVVASKGTNQPTSLPIGGLTIPAGQTYALYITYTSTTAIRYITGNGSNQQYQDANLKLNLGVGGGYFSVTNNPRVWSGRMFYSAGTGKSSCISSKASLQVDVINFPSEDAGISSIVNPSSSVFAGSPQIVQMAVANYGTDTLSSVDVVWMRNGLSPDTFHYSGTILYKGVDTINVDTVAFAPGVNNIIAWTTLPNGVADTINTNDTAFTSFKGCLQGTYLIGSGANADFASFNAAMTAVKNGGLCDHVIFNVDTGVYTEQLVLQQIQGMDSSKTITFQSLNGDSTGVILQYAGTSYSDNYVVLFDGIDYITFRKMTIKTIATTYGGVIQIQNQSTHVTLANNVIQTANGTSSSLRGIYSAGGLDDYLTIINNRVVNGRYAVYLAGPYSQFEKGILIKGNIIEGFTYYGIRLAYANSSIITENTLIQRPNTAGGYALYVYRSDKGIEVTKNKIISAPSSYVYGLYLNSLKGTLGNKVLVANNMIAITSGSGTSYGLYIYASENINAFYNSINMLGTSINSRAVFFNSYGIAKNIQLKNNIFRDTAGYTVFNANTSNSITLDYNNYYTNSSKFARYHANDVSDFAAWKAATGQDAHSLNIDVNFVSDSSLYLANSTLLGFGTPISSVSTDIDGTQRGIISTTIGAHELPLLPIDIALTDVLNVPDSTIEGQSYAFDVVIKNFGTDTITSGFNIKYKVNGGTAVSQQYTAPFFTGMIDTVSLTTFVSPSQIVDFCAYIELTTDTNKFNDTTCVNFFGVPLKDAKLASIKKIDEYCSMQNDTITIYIANIGIDTINSSSQVGQTTVSFKADNVAAATVITENFNAVVAPNDTVAYTFTGLADFTNSTQIDSVFTVTAWIDFPGDNVKVNDTAFSDVNSIHTPLNPVFVSPISTPYATTVSLSATAIDTILWFDTDSSTSHFHQGNTYNSNLLYLTDTLWLEASAGGGAFKLTETVQFKTGTGHTNPYPSYLPGSADYDGVEITNLGTGQGDLSGYEIFVESGTNHLHYVFPQGTVIASGDVVLAIYANTLTFGPAGNNVFVISNTMPSYISSNSLVAYWLKDASGNIVDAFSANGATFPANSGVTPADFSGSLQGGSGKAGAVRTISDNNVPSDWKLTSNTSASFGSKNASLPLQGGIGCASSRLPMVINVGAQPSIDVGVLSIDEPASGPYKTATDSIKVRVVNFGSTSQSNIPVNYSVNGGTVVSEVISSSIAANDTLEYTFNQSVDLSTMGATYNFISYTSLANDATALNDTIKKSVKHEYPVYCVSKASSVIVSEITNVTVGNTLNNNSVASGAKYTNFMPTVAPGFLQMGAATPLSITTSLAPNSSYNSNGYIKIFIDYNQDNDFNDAGETVFGIASKASITVNGSFTVPITAHAGLTVMRVVHRIYGSASNLHPCGIYSYGETEDYLVEIAPRIPHDAGVEMILSPSTLEASSSVTPVVRIRNYGTDTITSVDIAYVLNGATPVITTYNTADIYPMDSADVSLGSMNIQQGNNSFCAYTLLTDDSNTVNDKQCRTVFRESNVNLTYTDDFEGSDVWMADTIINQWERGTPAMTNINTAHSPVNVWGIDLDGNYANSSDDYLYSPYMVTTGLDSAFLKFWHYYNTGTDDGGAIEISMNKGSWITVGVKNDTKGTNWYNSTIGGNPFWSGNSNGWIESTYMINFSLFLPAGVNSADTIQFRYHFHSNGSGNSKDGWAIDDVSVELPKVATDGGVIAITNPIGSTTTGSSVTVGITVKNFGTSPLMTIPVVYTVGSAVETATIVIPSPGLLPDSTVDYTFTNTYVGPSADYNICAETNIIGDPYQQNDQWCEAITADKAPIDVNVFGITVNPAWADTTKITYIDTLTMHIENKGTTAITAMVLEYKVGGGVKQSVNWTGNLASGDTLDYTFATTFNSPVNWYMVSASATLANDADLTNNEFSHNYYGMNDIGFENNAGDIFSVDQNQPNPAQGEVVVNYNLPKSGKVHFELRNALGQVIMNQEYERSVGNNQIEIDATQLSSGIYYYTVEFDKQRITKKMVVNN